MMSGNILKLRKVPTRRSTRSSSVQSTAKKVRFNTNRDSSFIKEITKTLDDVGKSIDSFFARSSVPSSTPPKYTNLKITQETPKIVKQTRPVNKKFAKLTVKKLPNRKIFSNNGINLKVKKSYSRVIQAKESAVQFHIFSHNLWRSLRTRLTLLPKT